MENWKDIKGYGGYQVSDYGNVRSKNWRGTKTIRNLAPKPQNRGYLQVEITSDEGTKKTFLIHRLVAEAFLEKPNGATEINHIDENKRNNKAENLEWCDGSGNMKAYIKNHIATKPITRKERITQITKSGDVVREWENATLIKRELGYHPTSIWRCCEDKQRTAYGYKWRYSIGK